MNPCVCGEACDTRLSPFCSDCRFDPARLRTVIALRAELAQMERERDDAVKRAERAEENAMGWHKAYWRLAHPDQIQIGGAA